MSCCGSLLALEGSHTHFVQLWVDTNRKSSMHWQQNSPWRWHRPARTWARPSSHTRFCDRTWGISWARWAGPRAIPTQLHCSNTQLVMLWKLSQIWGRLKTLRKRRSGGQTKRLPPPSFLSIPISYSLTYQNAHINEEFMEILWIPNHWA